MAISPSERANGRSVVYAGTEPSNLYRSDDDGRSWRPFPALHDIPSAPRLIILSSPAVDEPRSVDRASSL